jgi:biopolymer transport protein ExbD
MAGTEITQGDRGPQKKGRGGRRPRRRVGIRIDMTPMVDVAFLLLIFFMVTTVFRRPLAMEVNMPEPGAKVEVPESNVMTIYVHQDGSMAYKLGRGGLVPVTWEALQGTFEENVRANPELIVLAKIDPQARYENMVDMMDTLEDAHMERFSVVRMDAGDLQTQGGKP